MIYVNREHATEHEVPGRRDPRNTEVTQFEIEFRHTAGGREMRAGLPSHCDSWSPAGVMLTYDNAAKRDHLDRLGHDLVIHMLHSVYPLVQ
jgi:hypothetical protein